MCWIELVNSGLQTALYVTLSLTKRSCWKRKPRPSQRHVTLETVNSGLLTWPLFPPQIPWLYLLTFFQVRQSCYKKKNCCQTFDWHEQQKSRIYRCETWGIHITWWRNNCRPTLWLQIDCRISLCTPQGIEMTQSSFYSWDKTLEGQGVHKCSRFCDTQQMWHTSCYVLVLVLDSLLNKKVQKDWAETIQ